MVDASPRGVSTEGARSPDDLEMVADPFGTRRVSTTEADRA
jgi:hypothetical protein